MTTEGKGQILPIIFMIIIVIAFYVLYTAD
jgi:hypothetical protein